jgi:hypothetical protein
MKVGVNIDLSQSPSTRRIWLQRTAGAMVATLASRSLAGEGKGSWSDQSIAEYSQKLIDWLKANFAQRASTLVTAVEMDFTLDYDYLAPTQDRARLREFERFAEGKLSQKAGEAHLTACLTEFELIRQSLAEAEGKAFEKWKAPAEEKAIQEGRIYDSSVVASRLTVVLDRSRSMTPYLESVRKEITRDFAGAYFVEVNGCQMERMATCPWFFAAPSLWVNPFAPERHIPRVPTLDEKLHSTFIGWTRDAPAALECMVDLMKSDAIYWFCDFDDETTDDLIKAFAAKLLAQKTKLFIHSLDKKPPTLLATLAEKSGGAVIRKRI